MQFTAVILAAGKGVRMKSKMPKVLHRLAGLEMILHVVRAVRQVGVQKIVVIVGHGRQEVRDLLTGEDILFALQEEQLGTGHALMQARPLISDDENLLVLAGDTPLLRGQTMSRFVYYFENSGADAAVLSTAMEEPFGYGRIIRGPDTMLTKIVEEKDALPEEKKSKEINSGIYCFKGQGVFDALSRLDTANAQGEYYLTDVFPLFIRENKKVEVYRHQDSEEIQGINNRVQLYQAGKALHRRKNLELMEAGVTMIDPDTTFIDLEVEIGMDTIIHPQTIIQGRTCIGQDCEIGPQVQIHASQIGDGVKIDSSIIKEASIADCCQIGPYSYLRPGTILREHVKIGDFVEIKKSLVGEGSKIPHLSYIGDALLGKRVNVGAGTITCNYDGRNKYQTVLEDDVFIGSNTNLIAPITIGKNARTGAGSTLNKDVPPHALAVERAKPRVVEKKLGRKIKEGEE